MPPKKGKGKKKIKTIMSVAQKAGIKQGLETRKKNDANAKIAEEHFAKKTKSKVFKKWSIAAKKKRDDAITHHVEGTSGMHTVAPIASAIASSDVAAMARNRHTENLKASLTDEQAAQARSLMPKFAFNSASLEELNSPIPVSVQDAGDLSVSGLFDEDYVDNRSSMPILTPEQAAGSSDNYSIVGRSIEDVMFSDPNPPNDPDDPDGGGSGGGDDRKDIKKKSDSDIYMSRNDLRLRNAMIRFYKSNTPGNIEKFRISNFDAYSDVAKRVLNNPENKIMLENLYRENRQTQAIVDPIGFVKERMKKENNKVRSLLNDMKSADVMKNLQGNTPLQTEEHVSRYFRRGIEDLVRDVDDEFPINAIRQAMTGSGATGAKGNVVKKSKTKKA